MLNLQKTNPTALSVISNPNPKPNTDMEKNNENPNNEFDGLAALYDASAVCSHTGASIECSKKVNAWIEGRKKAGFDVRFEIRANGAPFLRATKPDGLLATTYGGHCDAFGRTSYWN
jgi:hypothetical protein